MKCPTCHAENKAGAASCDVCGATLTGAPVGDAALPPGTRLHHGTYLLGRRLGQGGFGITYLATAISHRQPVAIKEFFPALCRRRATAVDATTAMSEEEFTKAREGFLQEAATLELFDHPGIIRVRHSFEENNTAYMVMEFLQGQTLGSLLKEHGGRLDAESAVPLVEQVALALQAVHLQQVLHRDVKPDNIMMCPNGAAVLIDFGSARDIAGSQARGHTIMVTPGYAPLEQYARHARRGPYTDLYSLGATLYHLLTGFPPPVAVDRASGVQLPSLRQMCPEVAPAIAEGVEWALQMKVDDRPQSALEFAHALRNGVAAAIDYRAAQQPEPVSSEFHSHLERYYQLPALRHSAGYFEIDMASSDVLWPDFCACCGAKWDQATGRRFSALQGRLGEPYCKMCRSHLDFKEWGLDAAILSSFVIALFAGFEPFGTVAEAAVFRPPANLILPVSFLLLGLTAKVLLQFSRPTQSCSGRHHVVERRRTYMRNLPYTYRFRSRHYADAFVRLNTAGPPEAITPEAASPPPVWHQTHALLNSRGEVQG